MAAWRRIRNSVSVFMLVVVLLYVAYCTEELYSRLQNNRKFNRLQEYERDIDELTTMLEDYKRDASQVKKSLGILQDALGQIVHRKGRTFSSR